MITEEVVTNFLRENWVPVLCLIGMVLILVGVLVDQAFKEARWRRDKQRRAVAEWASREAGLVCDCGASGVRRCRPEAERHWMFGGYWQIRRVMRWLSLLLCQQCSGKQRAGYALEWCVKKAFHDGPCVNCLGEEFHETT